MNAKHAAAIATAAMSYMGSKVGSASCRPPEAFALRPEENLRMRVWPHPVIVAVAPACVFPGSARSRCRAAVDGREG